jgi:plastocyanin
MPMGNARRVWSNSVLMRPRTLLAFTLVAGALAVLPVSISLAQSKGVVAYDATFSPSSVSIEPGDSVTWTNVGDNVHNIIGTSSNWPAGERLLVPGGSQTIDFALEGTYSYTCEYHPSTMKGAVTVRSAGPEPTESPSYEPDPFESPPPSTSPEPTEEPSAEPTEAPSPSPTPSPTPTVLPAFGSDPGAGAPAAPPPIAAGSLTPPADSAAKPPLTILGGLAVILLLAANPLFKPRAEVRVTRN